MAVCWLREGSLPRALGQGPGLLWKPFCSALSVPNGLRSATGNTEVLSPFILEPLIDVGTPEWSRAAGHWLLSTSVSAF